MDIGLYYTEIMSACKDILILSGFVALTINLIVMLINILINAFCGKGFKL